MATEKEYQGLLDRVAALRTQVTNNLAADLVANPQLADALTKQIDDLLNSVVTSDTSAPLPPDQGLSALAGVGPAASSDLGDTRIPQGVTAYDDTITSERIIAVGDMYYLWQHEKIGVFRVVQKLQELFRAGTVRLSGGQGAFALYQFDRRQVLRYTHRDRIAAYRRLFGYGGGAPPVGARPNTDFHALFTHFIQQVTLFWRDKRISDVIRERAYDPSFGSIAIVRRAGLDLRNNLKWLSFGDVNVLRVEVMQLLDEAFKILDAPDVKNLFGAMNAWDVIEEVLIRYFKERLVTSPRQRMGVTGRDVLRWLAQPYILTTTRAQFETLLLEIAESAEEWLTSAQSMQLASRTATNRVLPWTRSAPVTPAAGRPPGGIGDRALSGAGRVNGAAVPA
jgi:hypothetical protein